MQSVYAGTSGFSYKEWKGPFYPQDIKDKDFLSYYGSRLNTVEINNTFYRMPKQEVLAGWHSQTPDHFRFVIKASRRITHFKRLKDADEPMGYLVKNTAVLEQKLGAVLFQLPSNLRCQVDRLQRFLDLLPVGFPAVLEFRHESWFCDPVVNLLRDRNLPMCLSDSGETDALSAQLPVTADWCYCRLRRPAYDSGQLKDWADFLKASGFKRSFLFFKHETDGAGPLMAEQFLRSLARRKSMQVA